MPRDCLEEVDGLRPLAGAPSVCPPQPFHPFPSVPTPLSPGPPEEAERTQLDVEEIALDRGQPERKLTTVLESVDQSLRVEEPEPSGAWKSWGWCGGSWERAGKEAESQRPYPGILGAGGSCLEAQRG